MVPGNRNHRQHSKRVLLHALDNVFQNIDTTDRPHHQEPASIKKILKGDISWATWKTILGWIIDILNMMVELPPYRIARLFKLLDSVTPSQWFVNANKWEKLLGKLWSMALAIRGGQDCSVYCKKYSRDVAIMTLSSA
jgi:hypothetical protein